MDVAWAVSHAWSDPEFWGPVGLGCDHCYTEPAITKLVWGSLGFECIAKWYPGRSTDWMLGWFYRQRVLYLAARNRKKEEGRQLALRGFYEALLPG